MSQGESPRTDVPGQHEGAATSSVDDPEMSAFAGESAVQQPTTTGTQVPGQPIEPGESGPKEWPSQPTYVPLVDIYNLSTEIRVIVDTPGFNEDDISIECDNGTIIITGGRDRDDPEVKQSGPAHIERPRYLERRIRLPPGADPDHAWATHENGTTTIVFDKNESERHHHIGFQ